MVLKYYQYSFLPGGNLRDVVGNHSSREETFATSSGTIPPGRKPPRRHREPFLPGGKLFFHAGTPFSYKYSGAMSILPSSHSSVSVTRNWRKRAMSANGRNTG